MGDRNSFRVGTVTHHSIYSMNNFIPKFGEAQKERKEVLMTAEKSRKMARKVVKIAGVATGCAIVAVAFVIGMQVDYLRTPVKINFQSPVIWRSVPSPTPVKKAYKMPVLVPQVMAEAVPLPKVQVSILNNIRMDSEQRQNAELIREAFPEDAQRMIAIAMAESGLRCGSINHQDSNGVQAVGLFQINDGRLFSAQDIANLTTCSHNIERAKQKYNSQGVTAWGAFTSGAFYKYL